MTRRPALPKEVSEHLGVFEDRLRQLADGSPTHEVVDDIDRATELAVRAAYRAGEKRRAGPETAALVGFAETISANLRSVRNESGWTQEQLARGMSTVGFDWKRITVAEVEAGSRRVSLEELVGLAALFGETVLAFLDLGPNYLRVGTCSISRDDMFEMFLGEQGQASEGGPTWVTAAWVAGAQPGEHDWRPASTLWERRRKGYGMVEPHLSPEEMAALEDHYTGQRRGSKAPAKGEVR